MSKRPQSLAQGVAASDSDSVNGFVAHLKSVNLPKLFAVTVQLGMVILVINLFRIEESSGLLDVVKLLFGGFVVHALLPLKFRQPFFFALTLGGIVMLFGPVNAAWLTGIGLALIGMCHLPIPMKARVALITLVGAGLVAMRAEWFTTDWSGIIIAVLGSMFMFRIALYLYDMRNEKTPATLWERLCYFFQLPNILFPFYPIIDYITYRRTYYNKDAITIYQKGVLWMMRGTVHLILYRVVYYHMSPAVEDIQTLGGVVLFIISSYLLYLRISGLFHLIVGMLCLFGFNLPETHKLYFMANSFNDYWRRINIYWKDFMMKLFFYPIYMKTRSWGNTPALVFSTLVVFACTWILHSYQWFWLQGAFPLTTVDGVYWGVLGVLVAINSVWESSRSKKKALPKKGGWQVGPSASLAFRTVVTFVFLSIMWSFWSSESAAEWWSIMRQSGNSGAAEYGLLGLGLVGLFLAVFAWILLEKRGFALVFDEHKATWGRTVAFTCVAIIGVYAVGQPKVQNQLGDQPAAFLASLKSDRFSITDDRVQERGYYEQLLDTRVQMSRLWESRNKRPADWKGMVPAGVARETDNMLYNELFPNIETVFKRAPLQTNEWRMRDLPYTEAKPDNTVRMAMLGKSYEMGWGVANDQIFEQVVEDRLNREVSTSSDQNYEILNFSVGGYTVVQYVVLMEEKVPNFDPDVLLVTAHAYEGGRAVTNVLKLISNGVTLSPSLQAIVDDAGIKPGMVYSEMKRLLDPYQDAMVRWGYERIIAVCEAQDITPVFVFVPRTHGAEIGENEEEFARFGAIAEEFGFEYLLDLTGAYGDHEPATLQLAEWDTHPNKLGHKLIANKLYEVLQDYPELLGMPEDVLRAEATD